MHVYIYMYLRIKAFIVLNTSIFKTLIKSYVMNHIVHGLFVIIFYRLMFIYNYIYIYAVV